MTRDVRLKAWLSAIGAGGTLVSMGLPALCWSHLPERVATHWSLGGVPNGSMQRSAAMGILGAALILPIALSWPRSGRAMARTAALVGCMAFLSALLAFVGVTIVVANWQRVRWTQAAHLPPAWVLSMLLVSGLIGFLLFTLAQRAFPDVNASLSSALPLELSEGERVFWVSGASNRWLLLIAAIAAAIAAALLATGSLRTGAVHLLIAGTLELFSRIRVTVNERVVSIYYGHLGWVRQHFRVSRIVQATSCELVPMAHSGWGYRGSLALFRRAAVVVRRGAALSLVLAENRHLYITVDDAATAAKLLCGLLQRAELRSARTELRT